MEVTKITQINSTPLKEAILDDIKQSDEWKDFFKSIGLDFFTTSKGNNVFYIKSILGNFGKLQKPKNLTNEELVEIDDYCKKLKLSFLKIDANLSQDHNVLVNNKYLTNDSPLTPSRAQFLDLTQSLDLIFKGFSRSAKYSINRSKRENDRVEFIVNPDKSHIHDFYYNVHKPRTKNSGFSSFNFTETLNVVNSFNKKVVLCNVYNKDNQISGSKIFLLHNNMAYYILGGTTEVGQKNKSGYLIVWELIKYFKENNIKVINFDGIYDNRYHNTFKNWIPFSNFKLKFGGHIVSYPGSYIKFYNPVFKMLPLFAKKNF